MLPWRHASPESERLRLIERYALGEESVAELSRQFGVSRKTAYKMIGRHDAEGDAGLLDRSRAPHHPPNATPPELVDWIIEMKRGHPLWGPKKVIGRLRLIEPDASWPSPSTAGVILDRAGLVKRRRRRRRSTPWGEPFSGAKRPNDVWSIDFKGWFRTADGTRIDPLTVQDAASRYLLVCDGLERPNGPEARRVLERAFREYGLPRAIRTDNGAPFASVGLGSLSPLSVWWVKLGIIPERIEPGHPEQNGRLERLHRTLKAETATPPQANRRRQRHAFDPLQGKLQQREAARDTRTDASGQSVHAVAAALPFACPFAGVHSRGPRAQGPHQRTDQVEGRRGVPERVAHRRAGGPCPAGRADLVDTVRAAHHRRAGRRERAGRQDPYKSVTYVPGLTVTHVPGRTGDPGAPLGGRRRACVGVAWE